MKTKKLRDYLPKETAVVLVQAKLPEGFFDQVNSQRKKDGVTWYELIVAAFEKYLSESKA